MLFNFISVLIIIVCIILILIVLVQNSKGGGLASSFASSNQFMGVRKTADFLEKATWTLAATLLFLCILTGAAFNHGESAPKSAIDEQVKNTPDPRSLPNFPNAAPAANKPAAAPAGQNAKPFSIPASKDAKKK